jgi:membrane associated rhomboid family serine protease
MQCNNCGLPQFSFHSYAHRLMIAILVASVLFGLSGQLGIYLLLVPALVIEKWMLWQPFTSLFVATSPVSIIFSCLIVYSMGSNLENCWNPKRFLTVALGIPLAANFLTVMFALLLPGIFGSSYYSGANSVLTAIWISYGLRAAFSREVLNFWGVPLKGTTFALIGLGFVVLQGIFSSFILVFPEILSAGITYWYMYRRGDFQLLKKLQLAYYEWRLKQIRSTHNIRVVKGGRDREEAASQKLKKDDFTVH